MQCSKRIRVQRNCLVTRIRNLIRIREKGHDVTVVTVHGRRVKSRVLSVPARLVLSGIRVVVEGTSTVSGSRRIIPNTPPDPEEGLES